MYPDHGPIGDLYATFPTCRPDLFPSMLWSLQNSVITIPIVEEAHRSSTSSSWTQPYAATQDSNDIEDAIKMGDWTSVAAAKATFASSKSTAGARIEKDDDSSDLIEQSDSDDDDGSSGSDSSVAVPYGVRMSAESADTDANRGCHDLSGSVTADSDIERAAEIDHLVESGYWESDFHCKCRNWDVRSFGCMCDFQTPHFWGKLITQGARAAVERTAKREAGKSGRPPTDDESSEGISASERSVATLVESDIESVIIETADESTAHTESSRESTYATGEVITAGSRSVTYSSSDANGTHSRSRTSSSGSNVGIATLSGSATSSSGVRISMHSLSFHHG